MMKNKEPTKGLGYWQNMEERIKKIQTKLNMRFPGMKDLLMVGTR